MTQPDWHRLDPYTFVRMVADLLTGLGFVDVTLQGVGPDGGVDLFATELIPFVVQGRVQFRWAVQCKFSSTVRGPSSVRENEVRDVEGILRSDRFHGLGPQGYLLVTNRPVAQNVVERLRGIDRTSPFRTAIIDLACLNQFINDQIAVREKYFGVNRVRTADLAIPKHALVASTRNGLVRVELNGADQGRTMQIRALLDTGFSGTLLLPLKQAMAFKAALSGSAATAAADGFVSSAWLFDAGVRLRRQDAFVPITCLAADSDAPLIGMDFLRRLSLSISVDPTGETSLFRR